MENRFNVHLRRCLIIGGGAANRHHACMTYKQGRNANRGRGNLFIFILYFCANLPWVAGYEDT